MVGSGSTGPIPCRALRRSVRPADVGEERAIHVEQPCGTRGKHHPSPDPAELALEQGAQLGPSHRGARSQPAGARPACDPEVVVAPDAARSEDAACPAVPGGSPAVRHQSAGARPGRVAGVPRLQRGQHQGVRELPHSRAADDRKVGRPGQREVRPVQAAVRFPSNAGDARRISARGRARSGPIATSMAACARRWRSSAISNLRVLRAFAAGEEQKPWNTWQIAGLSAENADFVRSFDLDALTAESGAALFWYVRNALYFELRAAPASRYHSRQLR